MDSGPAAARDELWRLVNSYPVPQMIAVAASLGLADLLAAGPRPVAELASLTGCAELGLYRLLRALASFGIFAETARGIEQTARSEYLRGDVPGSIRDWACYLGRPYAWAPWGHLLQSVQTGRPAFDELYGMTTWEYRQAHPEEAELYDRAMTSNLAGAAAAIVASYDFAPIGLLVDVGGGQGALLAAILTAYPRLHGVLFDQPQVVAGGRAVLERAGVLERCSIVGGSFFEAVPPGGDAYLLKSVLHDWDDAAALKILQTCRAAMPAGAKLLLVEAILRPGNDPDPMKLVDLHMLLLLGGRERSAEELEMLLSEAGFARPAIRSAGPRFSILETRPA